MQTVHHETIFFQETLRVCLTDLKTNSGHSTYIRVEVIGMPPQNLKLHPQNVRQNVSYWDSDATFGTTSKKLLSSAVVSAYKLKRRSCRGIFTDACFTQVSVYT